MSETVLALSGIVHTFVQGKVTLEVLRGADLEINEGEIVALVGPSGSGKSTLLHIAGLLEPPTSGGVDLCGEDCGSLGDHARTGLRRNKIGFVYQYHHLLPEFTALENIAIPQIIAGIPRSRALERALELLEWLGLGDRAKHRPGRLSGGEQQRVAIARALAKDPDILLCDEPTGNLDFRTGQQILGLLQSLTSERGKTCVLVTHNSAIAAIGNRALRLRDGRVQSDEVNSDPVAASDVEW